MSTETAPTPNAELLPDEYVSSKPLTTVPDSTTEMPVYTGPEIEDIEKETSESPAAIFNQDYEKVKNSDVSSSILDHVRIWFRGGVDGVQKSIDQLEERKNAELQKADRLTVKNNEK